MRHSAPSILQDVQTRLVLVESGKLTGDKQMQSGMSCILPRRTWAALLYLLIPGIPEPNQASIRRSRTVSFSRSSHPDEQSMI